MVSFYKNLSNKIHSFHINELTFLIPTFNDQFIIITQSNLLRFYYLKVINVCKLFRNFIKRFDISGKIQEDIFHKAKIYLLTIVGQYREGRKSRISVDESGRTRLLFIFQGHSYVQIVLWANKRAECSEPFSRDEKRKVLYDSSYVNQKK